MRLGDLGKREGLADVQPEPPLAHEGDAGPPTFSKTMAFMAQYPRRKPPSTWMRSPVM